MIKGLLDSITSTAESTNCPGVCVHTLATLICYEVLEDVPCPSSSMKCCVEHMPTNTTKAPSILSSTTTGRPITTIKPKATIAPTVIQQTTTNTEKVNNKKGDGEGRIKIANLTGFIQKLYNSIDFFVSIFLETSCSGVCVPDHISNYCEAYLITPGLCKSGTKCCVSRDIYPDGAPVDLRIPTKHAGNKTSNNKSQTKVNVIKSRCIH